MVPRQRGLDDVGMDGLILIACHISQWSIQTSVTLEEGEAGDWLEEVKCPEGSFIYGGQVLKNNADNKDDTGINDIKIFCRNPSTKETSSFFLTQSDLGDWVESKSSETGYWKSVQVKYDPNIIFIDNRGINGFKVIYEDILQIIDFNFEF